MPQSDSIKTIDEYIEQQPEKTQQVLRELRKIILEAAPDASELINYEIPAFALTKEGKRDQQIMIAGYKNHVGLYPNPATIEQFEHELKDYKHSKGAVQFPISQPLPKDLIIRMVTYRQQQLRPHD